MGDTPGRIPAQLEGVRFYGSIHGAMQLDMGEFIVDSRAYFKGKEMYIEDRVTPDEAVFENGSWTCRGESYKWLVFCEGHYGFDNLWFDFLPFHTAKGELLICEIPGLVSADIIKGGVTIVPLPDPHIFWVGSTYEWDTDDDSPSAGAREELESTLEALVGKEYTVLTHRAGIRPAARDRRPFVGTHPANRQLGLINGLGTKGASLAPYCAEQLVSHLLDGNTLDPEIDLLRYHDS